MPVELRKRKAPTEPAPPPPPKKKSNAVKNAASKVKAAVTGDKPAKKSPPAVGDTVPVDSFGGEVETNDGAKTSLGKLLAASKSGVVLFTYPKASTPGCTKQACLFRDGYAGLTSTGFAIYGLSRDSPKANTTFKDKQNLPYPLLCDSSASLIGAIGLKKHPSGTVRGVFVVDKAGKVLASESGGPDATVLVVRKLVTGPPGQEESKPVTVADAPEPAEPEAPAVAPKASTAADVAVPDAPAEAPAAASSAGADGFPEAEVPVNSNADDVAMTDAPAVDAPAKADGVAKPAEPAAPAEPAPEPATAPVAVPAPVPAPAPVVESSNPVVPEKPAERPPTPVANSEPAKPDPVASQPPKSPAALLVPIGGLGGQAPASDEPASKPAASQDEKKTELFLPTAQPAAAANGSANGAPKESDASIAKVAADVADSATAAKVDPATPNPV